MSHMSHTDPDETYLTVAEVAETLKLNQQTVRNWIDQGALPALRVGRRVRIKRSDFERILEESYSGAPGAAAPGTPGQSAGAFWVAEPVAGGETVGWAQPAVGAGDGGGVAERAAGASANGGP